MGPTADREILECFRAGYKDVAFRMLVETHGKKVYNIALFMLNDEMLAEDATQDVFVKIYRGLSKFRQEGKLSTWIYRIVKNVCYDYLKRDKKMAVDSLYDIHEKEMASNQFSNPEEELHIKWQRMRVRRAVEDLPSSQRLVITLFYFHEKSYDEIARIMNLSLGTVKSHIHRGKSRLAQVLSILEGERI